ncbi:MAG TPA: protein kinase, partial [Pirellula sp.]|nr:protein kinase [Pirellula sp.]
KPSNILLEPCAAGNVLHAFQDEETVWIPRITDFGISKALEETESQTRTGTIMGTLEYMSPEQISGRTSDIGTHSDIYSIGVILYEMLAGKLPYSRSQAMARGLESLEQGSSPSVRKIRSDVPRDLDAILQKCIRAEENGRYKTAAELLQELQNYLMGRPIQARPLGHLARVQKWMIRQPLAASLAVACIVSLLVGLTAVLVADQKTRFLNGQLTGTNENLAKAVIDADRERDLAKQSARALRLQAYCEDLSSADAALRQGDISRSDFLLRRQMESSNGDDLRDLAWHYLWRKCHRPFSRIHVSNAPLYSVRFSSDGLRTAICGADGWIRIFDTRSTTLIMEWSAGQSELNCAVFSTDDRYLATAGDDGTICVWDIETQKSVNQFRAHQEHAFNAVFASEDKMFTC